MAESPFRFGKAKRYYQIADALGGRRTAMTVAEVAELLQVSQRHIYQLVQDGHVPHLMIGKAIRFDPDQLGAWLKKQAQGKG